jgi:hypothetical protein
MSRRGGMSATNELSYGTARARLLLVIPERLTLATSVFFIILVPLFRRCLALAIVALRLNNLHKFSCWDDKLSVALKILRLLKYPNVCRALHYAHTQPLACSTHSLILLL